MMTVLWLCYIRYGSGGGFVDRSPELSFLEVDRLEEEEEVLVDDMVAEPRSEMA